MVLEDSSGGWTATEVDPAVTSDVGLIDRASQFRLARHRTRPVGVIFQGAVVLATAVAVGLAVFFLIRSAATSDAGEEQAQVHDEIPTVGLDVEDGEGSTADGSSGIGSSRTGSKRNTLEDGIPEGADEDGEEVPVAMAATADDENSDEAATAGGNTDQAGADSEESGDPTEDGSVDPTGGSDEADPTDPSSPTTAPDQNPSPSTSTPPTTDAPTTTTIPTTATTPAPTTATTEAPTTTGQSTTTTATTIPPTTTTSQPTVSTLAVPLIAAPVDGSVHTWEAGISFEANGIADAVQYCWLLDSVGDTDQVCRTETTYTHPGGEGGINPGPVTVTATARADDGEVLRTETISITVLAGDIIKSPDPGEEFDNNEVVRVRFEDLPGATDYCVTLRQGSTALPTKCDNDDRVNVSLRPFEHGSVTVQAGVFRRQQLIGRQSIVINYHAG